jgi:sensor histidine kinase regulating citrate/malate metabolism
LSKQSKQPKGHSTAQHSTWRNTAHRDKNNHLNNSLKVLVIVFVIIVIVIIVCRLIIHLAISQRLHRQQQHSSSGSSDKLGASKPLCRCAFSKSPCSAQEAPCMFKVGTQ